MIPDGARLLAFVLVAAVVWLGPFIVLWWMADRGIATARAAWEERRLEELELRRRDRALLERIGAAIPMRADRAKIGFVHRGNEGRHGDGFSGVIVIYEPAESDDAARTGRESM